MSTATTPRHALGWPPGSIRAILALMVVGLICALLLIRSHDQYVTIPAYLWYLMFLTLGHYFAARGSARGGSDSWKEQPLWLPRGCIRLVLLAALSATVIYRYVTDPASFEEQMERSLRSFTSYPMLPIIIQGCFFVGALLRMVIGQYPPAWVQDFEAWLSLIAVLLMAIATMIHLVINPSLSEELSLPFWEGMLCGVIAFYFGERS